MGLGVGVGVGGWQGPSHVGKNTLRAGGRMDGKERDQRVGDHLEDTNSRKNTEETLPGGSSNVKRKQMTKASNTAVIKCTDFK